METWKWGGGEGTKSAIGIFCLEKACSSFTFLSYDPPLCRGKSEEKGQDTERVLLAVVRGDTLGAWQDLWDELHSWRMSHSLSPSHPSSRYSDSKPT